MSRSQTGNTNSSQPVAILKPQYSVLNSFLREHIRGVYYGILQPQYWRSLLGKWTCNTAMPATDPEEDSLRDLEEPFWSAKRILRATVLWAIFLCDESIPYIPWHNIVRSYRRPFSGRKVY